MTRVLAELLGVERLQLAQTIRSLEAGAGHQSYDIRLTTEMQHRVRGKVKQLGLDPEDTTGPELLRALQARLARDESLLRQELHIAPEADDASQNESIAKHVNENQLLHTSFALKQSVAKKLLRAYPPKRAMKKLGYRSLDSLLKHEPVAAIYAAAWLSESLAWRKRYLAQYGKLSPSDFESRRITTLAVTSSRWRAFSEELASLGVQSVVAFNDIGAIVLLPHSTASTGGLVSTLVLTLGAANDIASVGSYLKLQQVQPTFGTLVASAAEQEPMTNAELNNEPVPWRILHQFYARISGDESQLAVFEPHVQASDLGWHAPEYVAASIHPALEFWHDTQYCAFAHDGQVVSLNILDVAMSYRAQSPVRHFMSLHLWQELLLRYLDPVNVEHALMSELTPDASKLTS